ncbi:MAG: NADH-quinone oxidoreductase subunit L [Candidatus Berkiella sp.]
MQNNAFYACLVVVFSPLVAALLAGLLGKQLGRKASHSVAILAVGLSFCASVYLAKLMLVDHTLAEGTEYILYQWASIGKLDLKIAFLLDHLTILMINVVTFVSWMVHIYTIGYMEEDPGYQRFFSYIALFTFSMLMLVLSNNFLQLFFGWEAVGLVSYLLIGFWYTRETAIFANMKAFLVNRVGDFGFLLGIGAVLAVFGTLDYNAVFEAAPKIAQQNLSFEFIPGQAWNVITVICLLLFVGAMGKSAQVPLHVWLPDSMEGPTPISALIHAATMVTAGVFMIARMSPLFEYSEAALSVVLLIGSVTCFFMGLIAIVQNDIKRVVAYSTLSQLGYMIAATGASAYAAGMFHLMTHAFFKALLFLGAGAVIIVMHHEQDIRNMGGLRKYMPVTYWTMFLASLALIGFPFFSGFYSKDTIIEAIHLSEIYGSTVAYWAVLSSVFVTALYSFRMFFLVFHTKPRMDEHTKEELREAPAVVWGPLALLAIPSVFAGLFFADFLFTGNYFAKTIFVLPEHDVLKTFSAEYHGAVAMGQHGFQGLPFYLAMAGVFTALVAYVWVPSISRFARVVFSPVVFILEHKYGFDIFNQKVIAPLIRGIGRLFWRVGDQVIIDGLVVNGTAKVVHQGSKLIRRLQSGYVYHYAFAMISGLILLLLWLTLH